MSRIDRRTFLASVAAGAALAGATPRAHTAPPAQNLGDPMFRPLPLGDIRPAGWLQHQLRIQAGGLSGHLDEFWPDVGQSQWFGGSAEGWERAPYWLDGAIPLAWVLDDAALKTRVTRYVELIVARQRADGWYGPYPEDAVTKRYDLWAILLANKVLAQYHDATGDARVLAAIQRSLRALLHGLDRTPLYGLVLDDRQPAGGLVFEERPVGAQPFSPDGAGVVATARARRIPGWKVVHGWAGELSPADVESSDPSRPISDQPIETVTLIPYGCTNIRITEFPKVG